MRRILGLFPALACLQGCITYNPQASTPVHLEDALKIAARDLNKASPVVLSDVRSDGKSAFTFAILARQCATSQADAPLAVITGPVSLQLQGQIQGQVQGGVGIGTASFQVQATRSQQQQLTVPITFVPASAMGNFFLGQNIPNVSGILKGNDADKAYQDEYKKHIQKLLDKAKAIDEASQAQIEEFRKVYKSVNGKRADKDKNETPTALDNYCKDTTDESHTLLSSDISVVIPEGFRAAITAQ